MKSGHISFKLMIKGCYLKCQEDVVILFKGSVATQSIQSFKLQSSWSSWNINASNSHITINNEP
jgi:hypothetical protein